MLKGKWQVTSNFINGKTMYAVYRIIDERKVDHSGNREYCGEYHLDKKAVERACEFLNDGADMQQGWRKDDLTPEQNDEVYEILHFR